jgi:hypothetical protein
MRKAKKLFHNFNTATHGRLKNQKSKIKNQIFDYFFDMVPHPSALNGSKKHQKTPFGAYLQFLS